MEAHPRDEHRDSVTRVAFAADDRWLVGVSEKVSERILLLRLGASTPMFRRVMLLPGRHLLRRAESVRNWSGGATSRQRSQKQKGAACWCSGAL